MGFDVKAYMRAEFQPRVKAVKLNAENLRAFFGDGEQLWTVRGQTVEEIARAAEAQVTHKTIAEILAAIGNSQEKIAELKNAIGMGDATPNEIVKRIEMLKTCSIEPEMNEASAAKLGVTNPVEFMILTNTISELTGLGQELKKPKPSGASH